MTSLDFINHRIAKIGHVGFLAITPRAELIAIPMLATTFVHRVFMILREGPNYREDHAICDQLACIVSLWSGRPIMTPWVM